MEARARADYGTSVEKKKKEEEGERFNHSPLGKHIYLEILRTTGKRNPGVCSCLVAFQRSTASL